MKKSTFNLSHTHLTSCDMGELIPIGLQEVVQGDTWQLTTNCLLRMSPMLAPPMHPTHMHIHHWFVPFRLLWDEFDEMITGGPDGTSAPEFPTITLPNSASGGVVSGTLADYLGIPLGYNADNSGYTVSALPFRAYAAIYNYFYRDEDLQAKLTIDLTSGVDTTTNTALQHACWEKDYYTTSRPSPQKGPAVSLPLGGNAAVVSNGEFPLFTGAGFGGAQNLNSENGAARALFNTNASSAAKMKFGSETGLEADLESVTAADITDLRSASAIQRLMERMSRHGSRITEYYKSMGIKSSDARFQNPEYLGGGKQTIQYSEVLQTAEGEDPVGSLKGHGIGAVRSNRFIRFFEEPGYILSLAYVTPKTIYTQGLARHWNRRNRLDFFQPELQFIGQQQVLNKEVYAPHTNPDGVFGYNDRYDEFRRTESRVSGEFRTTLDYWHFAREFSSSPSLNGDFVRAVPPDRPFAVPTEDVLYLMIDHRAKAKRLISRNATPKLM